MTKHKTGAPWRRGLVGPVLVVALAGLGCPGAPPSQESAPPLEPEVDTQPTRLYVLDCGYALFSDPTVLSLSADEKPRAEMATPCFLVEHEKGTLIWEAGLPEALGPEGMTVQGVTVRVDKSLTGQLEELGHTPGDVDFLAMSHMHVDHAGNSSLFKDATWLVRAAERDHAFGDELEPFGWDPSVFEALRDVEPVLIEGNHDVFGDGTVVIHPAPGHTPGHQVLFVDLAESGPIVLSGDVYHFPESRELRKVPTYNHDEAQTLASMDALEALLKETGAQLWIQHDYPGFQELRKSPEYYE